MNKSGHDKADVRKYTVQQNSYTHKHLLYHLTNHTQDSLPPEEIQLIINEEIMKSLDAPKDVLKQMLIQRYYAGRAQDNVPQPFPFIHRKGGKLKKALFWNMCIVCWTWAYMMEELSSVA